MVMEGILMKKSISSEKILKFFYSKDEDFIKDWLETYEKGILRFMVRIVFTSIIAFMAIGVFFIVTKRNFCGFQQLQIIPIVLIIGIIDGVIISIFSWLFNNKRYAELKERA
jgi:preprotein translocase subunit SecF